MKKLINVLCAVIMMLTVSVTAFAEETKLTAQVPYSHTVDIISNGGRIVLDGIISNGKVQVERHKEQTYRIIPYEGKRLQKLTYNGEDVTNQIKKGVFTASKLVRNAELEAIYTDAPASPDDRKYDISGKVTDDNGKPMSDVTIEIGGKTTVTDKNGEFNIPDVPSGTHYVVISDKSGKIIGSGELIIDKAEGKELTVKKDENDCTVIKPGDETKSIKLTANVEKYANVVFCDIQDSTPKSQQHSSQSQTQSQAQPKSSSPDTGDENRLIISVVLIFICGAVFSAANVYNSKKRKNR